MGDEVVLSTDLADVPLFKRGKVRDIYNLGGHLLIVATDRISAFDVVMSNGIPGKGRVLTQLSKFWFEFTQDIVKNHIVTCDLGRMTALHPVLAKHEAVLEGRAMLVKRTSVIPVECVVRGYLAGSAWREYQESGTVCGIRLPEGYREADRLKEPIFTPATKAKEGHDVNISEEEMRKQIGQESAEEIKEKALRIYKAASAYARTRGILISDTKFEFGLHRKRTILIDEVLTPDSSRFWSADEYLAGRPQPSFDKQYVRDYLEGTGWDKNPPGPELPRSIVEETARKYAEALYRFTGEELSG